MTITEPTTIEQLVRRRATQQITIKTDTRVILANATNDIEKYNLNDYFIVDVTPTTWSRIHGRRLRSISRARCFWTLRVK